MAVKAQILCEQAARVSRQTAQRTICNKATENVTPILNSKNFCSALPSFWLSVYKHKDFCSIHTQEALNTRLETTEHKQSAHRPMPLYKRTPQGQARRLQQQTRLVMHHTTIQRKSTSCFSSRRLPTVHTADTLRNNPLPLELRVFKVECTTESLYQLAFTQPYTQGSIGRGQAESQTSL